MIIFFVSLFFFFQAEDGIRDGHVTGVQTCALPICVFNFSLYTFNIKFIKKEQRTELLQLLDFIMETKYEDNSTGSEKLTKENIESEFMEKYDPSPPIDKSVGKSFFKKAYGYSF